MAEVIVPPSLRRAHRRGLAGALEGQPPKILDRRLELTGMRRDGTEFPIELTITRIALPGPPLFTGYLRDITERVRAEQALRESRVRLLEVADEERKRIQRNLHDGAQQRITAVLLNLGRVRERPEERKELLTEAIDELATGLEEIRALASGLHPAVLAERGLVPALRALVLASPIEVELATVPAERLPEQVEAAAYYVVAEALANVQKHAGASRVVVHASTGENRLVVEVEDDGVGGADVDGEGLRGLADRVEALGGRLSLDSPQAAARACSRKSRSPNRRKTGGFPPPIGRRAPWPRRAPRRESGCTTSMGLRKEHPVKRRNIILISLLAVLGVMAFGATDAFASYFKFNHSTGQMTYTESGFPGTSPANDVRVHVDPTVSGFYFIDDVNNVVAQEPSGDLWKYCYIHDYHGWQLGKAIIWFHEWCARHRAS